MTIPQQPGGQPPAVQGLVNVKDDDGQGLRSSDHSAAISAEHHQEKECPPTKKLKVSAIADPVAELELNKLSEQEKRRLYEEIKGKATIEEEDPAVVENCLRQMEEEIESLRHRSASSYNQACFLAPRVVKDRAFRLMFVRAALFDARKASKLIIKHFEHKMTLFGHENVAQHIRLDSLDVNDKISLRSGSVQLLPCTDTSGRAVLWFAPSQVSSISWRNELRVFWYILMVALENPSTQRRGIVFIIYIKDGQKNDAKFMTELIMNSYLLRDAMPVRVSAIHYCRHSDWCTPCLSLLRSVGGTEFRLRCIDHFGTDQELQYQLRQYGIAAGILPVDAVGNHSKADLNNYLGMRQQKEEEEKKKQQQSYEKNSNKPTIVDIATKRDVLFGRGKPYQEHEGNVKLSKMTESRQLEYANANRAGKTLISRDVVKWVKERNNGRFLKRDVSTGAWELVDDETARKKVSHGFK